MAQPGEGTELTAKAYQTGLESAGLEDLERDRISAGIAGEEHVGHAALSDGTLIAVRPDGVAGFEDDTPHFEVIGLRLCHACSCWDFTVTVNLSSPAIGKRRELP